MSSKLEEARQIINEVDAQMAELFVKRMKAAELVYEHKKEFGLPILDQARENAVIEKNTALIQEDVLKEYYIDYLKQLMSISRAYQYRLQTGLNVAYSGVEGAFAHIAAGRIFPEGNRISCRDF
ncbi:MAG: chorismate mutase, partial [Firmicutes bacterium]|nr:chorismate mutase [Bacillota bacterium]